MGNKDNILTIIKTYKYLVEKQRPKEVPLEYRTNDHRRTESTSRKA